MNIVEETRLLKKNIHLELHNHQIHPYTYKRSQMNRTLCCYNKKKKKKLIQPLYFSLHIDSERQGVPVEEQQQEHIGHN